jgi:hypothetical protein
VGNPTEERDAEKSPNANEAPGPPVIRVISWRGFDVTMSILRLTERLSTRVPSLTFIDWSQ